MYHFIGIKQPETCSLALLLHSLGYKVDGSDNRENISTSELLKAEGIKVLPISENNINEDMIVIQGEDILDDNIELVKANEVKIKIYSYLQMIKRITEMFQTITVSGYVGKEITTETMTYVLSNIIGCNYMLNDGRGYADRENKYLSLSTNENSFSNYNPYYSIINNIDLSSYDKYNSIDELIVAYQEFASRTEKMVLACGDDRYTHLLNVNVPIFYYGLNDDNDIIAKEVNYNESGTSFEVHVEDNFYGDFELPIYGKQMLLNVLSVIGICYYERIEVKNVSKALKEFFTNKKLFDEKQFKDTIIVNVSINNPREVKSIIKALKQKYPDKRLKSIFNPIDLFQDKHFTNGYIESLNLLDKSYIVNDQINDDIQDLSDTLVEIDKKEYIDLNNLDRISNNKNAILLFINKQGENRIQSKVEEIINNKNKKS